jgi:hypothetical protein
MRGWGCSTVKGFSNNTAPHPPPEHLPLNRSRWQAEQGGWDRATAYLTTCQPHALQCGPLLGSIVRDGTSAGSSPTSPREEFFRLYELGVAIRLRDRIAIRNAAVHQEISLSCFLQSSPITIAAPLAQRRCHWHCRRRVMTETNEASASDIATSAPSSAATSAPTPTEAKSPSSSPSSHCPNHRYPSTHCPSLRCPSIRQALHRTPCHRQLSIRGRRRGDGVRLSC